LKIAVESAQAYNRVKPPHQTVGDAVIFLCLNMEEHFQSTGFKATLKPKTNTCNK
jgi:hypothetical protein